MTHDGTPDREATFPARVSHPHGPLSLGDVCARLRPLAHALDRDEETDPSVGVRALASLAHDLLTGPTLEPSAPTPLSASIARAPEGLDELFDRALASTPEARPPSAGAFVRALVRVAEGRSLPPPTAPRPVEPPPSRAKPTGLWLALLTTLALALFAAWMSAPSDGGATDVAMHVE